MKTVRDEVLFRGIALILPVLAVFGGCQIRVRPVTSMSSLSMPAYIKAFLNGRSGTLSLDFPTLVIYDHAGKIVYFGTNESANGHALETVAHGSLPDSNTPGGPPLERVLASIPAVSSKADDIKRSKAIVISFTLRSCGSCLKQDEAIEKVSRKLERQGVSVIRLVFE
jgi:hypothetical protein